MVRPGVLGILALFIMRQHAITWTVCLPSSRCTVALKRSCEVRSSGSFSGARLD